MARAPIVEVLPLEREALGGDGIALRNTVGVRLIGRLEVVPTIRGLEDGTRALSLFVVNRRGEGEQGRRDEQFLFQVEL